MKTPQSIAASPLCATAPAVPRQKGVFSCENEAEPRRDRGAKAEEKLQSEGDERRTCEPLFPVKRVRVGGELVRELEGLLEMR